MTDPASRNVYRLQVGGQKLCEALQKILSVSDCPAAKDIARKALAHRMPDPDWNSLTSNVTSSREAKL